MLSGTGHEFATLEVPVGTMKNILKQARLE
jgi:hypothetical protein